MNALTAAAHLQSTSSSYAWRYKRDWLAEVQGYAQSHGTALADANVLELGAGIHNPLGSALVALANGARRAVAIEPSPPVPDFVSHAVMLGLVSSFMVGKANSRFTSAMNALIEMESTGDDRQVALPELELHRGGISDFSSMEQFEITHSNAVIEHVLDLQAACRWLYGLTRPNGVQIHKVDFIDHRYYEKASPEPADAFRFLMVGEEGKVPDCNGQRLCEVIDSFKDAGFEYLGAPQSWKLPVPASVLGNLQRRYSTLSDADLATTCAILIFRRPG